MRHTITEVAGLIGVTFKTITRWEKAGKIPIANRDFRGWRVYDGNDIYIILKFHRAIRPPQWKLNCYKERKV